MIDCEGLIKAYGLNPVLTGLNLHVPEGEFLILVGPNGAGKTTLLRIVATLLAPGGGAVRVGGWPLPRQANRVRPHIGLVSHQPLLYHDLTAAENLRFFASLYGRRLDDRAVDRALWRVGLAARARDPVGTFSRGMVQRLTIARATIHEPDVLLLDEPYTGLDQEASAVLDDRLLAEKGTGRTILMITHDLIRGYSLADRAVVLHRGRVAQEFWPGETSREAFVEAYAAITGRRQQPAPI